MIANTAYISSPAFIYLVNRRSQDDMQLPLTVTLNWRDEVSVSCWSVVVVAPSRRLLPVCMLLCVFLFFFLSTS